jgi:hypothetical protein
MGVALHDICQVRPSSGIAWYVTNPKAFPRALRYPNSRFIATEVTENEE